MSDRYEADIYASRVTEHSGLARSKSKFAIRVRSVVLPQVLKEVRPDGGDSAQVPVTKLFKLQPLPLGIVNDQIVSWAKSQDWQIRVIKKLGQDAALIGTSSEPPHKYLSMNGVLVLIRPIQSNKKGTSVTPLVAGPRPVVASKPVENEVELLGDPCSKYKPTNPTQVVKTQDPPTVAKFTAIESRLAQFESNMQTFQAQTDVLVKNMEAQNKFNAVAENRMSSIESRVDSIPDQVESAIVKAMASQERKLDSKFEALMQALTTGSKRNVPLADEEDHDMESTPVKPPPAKKAQ